MKHIKKYNESTEKVKISKEDIDMFFYELLDNGATSRFEFRYNTSYYFLTLHNYDNAQHLDNIYDQDQLNNYLKELSGQANIMSELAQSIDRLKEEYADVQFFTGQSNKDLVINISFNK